MTQAATPRTSAASAADAAPLLGGLRLEVVDAREAASTRRGEWRALVDRMGAPSPMLRPNWLLGWWDVYGASSDRLAIGFVYDGSALVGVAPFFATTHVYPTGLSFARLALLGCDTAQADGVCSDYTGLIAAPDAEGAVSTAVAAGLVDGAFGRWDELVIERTAGRSAADAFAAALSQRGVLATVEEQAVSSRVRLDGDFEDLLARMTKKRRAFCRKSLRDFDAWAGSDGWRLHGATGPDAALEGLAILKDLHRQRWSADENDDGAFGAPRFDRFHETFVAENAAYSTDGDGVDIRWLSVGGAPVAAGYWIRDRGTLFYYQTGRRVGLPNSIRLGTVLVLERLKAAVSEGVDVFDFMSGAQPYKLRLADETSSLLRLRAARPSWKESLRRSLCASRKTLQGLSTFGSNSTATLRAASAWSRRRPALARSTEAHRV